VWCECGTHTLRLTVTGDGKPKNLVSCPHT
jgi:hypothetical protein